MRQAPKKKRSAVVLRAVLAWAVAFTGLASARCARALDPALDISQYAHTAWKVRDGFTKGPPTAIAQTPDGYLWLGTEFGLYRFDGVRAVPWQPPNGEQLPSIQIDNLLVARDGTLWIATLKGLASWKGGKLTEYSEVAGQVGPLLQDQQGKVWVGGSVPGRLCAVQGGRIECYGAGSLGLWVTDLYEDHKGNLWLSAQTGVWRWAPGAPELHRRPSAQDTIRSLMEDDEGALLLGTNNGLKELVGTKIHNRTLPGISQQFEAHRLFRSSDGSLWIGSLQGLLHFHHGRADRFGVADGLSGENVNRIFEDREGNVWVSTMNGLDRFREYAFPTISTDQGLSISSTWAVQASPDGSIWIGGANGLNRWENGHVTIYPGRSTLGQGGRNDHQELSGSVATKAIWNTGLLGDVRTLAQDDQGRLWVSTGDGVFYFEGHRFVVVPGIPSGRIWAMAGDGKAKVWISNGTEGLFHFTLDGVLQQIQWSRFGQKNFGARALLPDRSQGGIWLGFYEGGLIYFNNGKVRASYSSAEGLGNGRVNDLRFGSRGSLWAATEGGLSRIRDGRVLTLTSKNGLPCDEVHWSIEDDDHFLWLYQPCGLARIARSELDAWVRDPSRKIQFAAFDGFDGVKSIGVYGSDGPHVAKSSDGKIWFIPWDGVSVIDPRHLAYNKVPPPVHVEQIMADGKTYDEATNEGGGLPLPAHVRDLTIDYTALSLAVPEKVHFRFKLEGQDRDWREVVNERHVQYSNLAPKKYRFRVTASNNSGVWNEEGASLDFSIAPAYYQTNWFRALCVAAFAVLLWALYQFRLHQVQQRFNAGLEGRVNERTRIARELHDTLLQNLHGLLFRFQAARNMLPRRPEEAMEALDGAISRTEQAITESQDAITDLRPEPTTSSDLAGLLRATGKELESTANTNGTPSTFSLTVEGEGKTLSPNLQEEIYRIARELLRNAFRHACAHRIEAEVRYDDEQLRVRIRDDGKGMDPEVLKKGRRPGHWGLLGAKERAQRIGARLDIWSEAGAGTEIQISVPAAVAYKNLHDRPRFSFLRKVKVNE